MIRASRLFIGYRLKEGGGTHGYLVEKNLMKAMSFSRRFISISFEISSSLFQHALRFELSKIIEITSLFINPTVLMRVSAYRSARQRLRHFTTKSQAECLAQTRTGSCRLS